MTARDTDAVSRVVAGPSASSFASATDGVPAGFGSGLPGQAGLSSGPPGDCRSAAQPAVAPPAAHVMPSQLGSQRDDLHVAVSVRNPGHAGALSRETVADGGNYAFHVPDDPALVRKRRAELRRHLALDEIQWLQQVHGCEILGPEALDPARAPTADGTVVNRRRCAAAILTADCLPVVFWVERQGGAVAAVHAGWQGLAAGILRRAVAVLRATAEPGDTIGAWLGPAICRAHYEIDATLGDRFDAWSAAPPGAATSHRLSSGNSTGAVIASPRLAAKRQLSLAGVACQQLQAAGVPQVTLSGWCSYGSPAFYSHRRAQHERRPSTGRLATLVWRS